MEVKLSKLLDYIIVNALVPAMEKHQNLRNWAKTFSPFHMLMLCGMKIELLEEYYANLSLHARKIDPISEWFLLQRLIKITEV
jgi:hypothetical protein